MKKIVCGLLIALALNGAIAQSTELGWHASIKVIDESAQPVSNAVVTVWFYVQAPVGQTEAHVSIQGVTDAKGLFTALNATNGSIDLGFQASKSGYYSATGGHEFNRFKDTDPEKRNPHATLLLKKIVNPIPMYAKRIDKGPPVFNEAIGYDLTAGDWVAPHGRGVKTDVIFNGALNRKAAQDFDYQLVVSFPSKGDGIQMYTTADDEKTSAFRCPYQAPESGYQTNVVRVMTRHPGRGTYDDSDKSRNYFFRARTVLDERGKVRSALYGKIYGDFMQFTYYLNPTPNDRNIEFDPKHNLLTGLKSFEQVSAP